MIKRSRALAFWLALLTACLAATAVTTSPASAQTGDAYRQKIASLLAKDGCANQPFKVSDDPKDIREGAGAVTYSNDGHMVFRPGYSSPQLDYIVAHECAHNKQFRMTHYDRIYGDQMLNRIYQVNDGGEFNADCVIYAQGYRDPDVDRKSQCTGAKLEAAKAVNNLDLRALEDLAWGPLLSPMYAEKGVGDFDGDGRTDVFTATWVGGRPEQGGTYQWKISSGGVTSWRNLKKDQMPLRRLGFGDFDGDGKTDIFSIVDAYPFNSGKLQYRYSSGGTQEWRDLAVADVPFEDLRFGDFNGDGKTDVFTATWTGKTYQWKYLSGGNGTWINIANAGNPLDQLRFGDFNGDGKTDVFTIAWTGRTYQWQYSAGGASNWKKIANAGNPLDQLRFGDFNGDGKTDVFTRAPSGSTFRWQYSAGGASNWKKMAESGAPLQDLRFG